MFGTFATSHTDVVLIAPVTRQKVIGRSFTCIVTARSFPKGDAVSCFRIKFQSITTFTNRRLIVHAHHILCTRVGRWLLQYSGWFFTCNLTAWNMFRPVAHLCLTVEEKWLWASENILNHRSESSLCAFSTFLYFTRCSIHLEHDMYSAHSPVMGRKLPSLRPMHWLAAFCSTKNANRKNISPTKISHI